MPSSPATLAELVSALVEEAFACETACEPHEHQVMPTTQIIVSKDGHLYRADLMERAAKVLQAVDYATDDADGDGATAWGRGVVAAMHKVRAAISRALGE